MNEKISNFSQISYIRRYTLTGGKESGLKVVEVNNGNLRFLLNESKALDIMQLWHKGENISFISKNGFNAENKDFIKRFEGGMLYTCGLDSVGAREGYPIHGSIHNLPAEIIRTECNEKDITVEALVCDTELFGKNIKIKRKIYTKIGGDYVSVEDLLVNEGYRDEKYCLLYHVNIGYPVLKENGKVIADVIKCEPRTEWAKKEIDKAFIIEKPYSCAEETCYFLTLKKPEITYDNGKKKITVAYSDDTLPHFVEWKSMASGDYALGLEPCTTELDGKFAYKEIKAGEEIKFNVKIIVKDNSPL